MILHTLLIAKSDKAIDGAQEGAPSQGVKYQSFLHTSLTAKSLACNLSLFCRLLYLEALPALYSKTKNQALVSIIKMRRVPLPAMQLCRIGKLISDKEICPLDILS